MTTVTVPSGVTLHVEDSGGDGRPVVLIHGWPLSGKSWGAQLKPFRDAGFRVITYDRRGFGESDKPGRGYDYNTLATDLKGVLDGLHVTSATLVGFSMGGGEIARYIGSYGDGDLHSVVFASSVPPYLLTTDDNPDGAIGQGDVMEMQDGLRADREGFFDQFTTDFYSVDGVLKVTEADRQEALALAAQAELTAAVDCIAAFGTTDFRADLTRVTVPTLVIHGDADATVPLAASGQRTHETIDGSQLHVVEGGPHGIIVSHAEEFNRVVLDFLAQ